ncbi:MAG: UDP-N-acetylmuramoyl-L-alanine--D-glutamate ligase, partial [Muribaculaceae bacterium]|nr:UDP-N-acetylmuramoyl-L-alanine--D-glutamate ligase [Muribaculaceae bacterium]
MSINKHNIDTDGRLVVLGGGESGAGAAVLGKVKGMDVFLSDMGTIAPRYRAILEAEQISWEDGRHSEELILNADEVVKSPGIP